MSARAAEAPRHRLMAIPLFGMIALAILIGRPAPAAAQEGIEPAVPAGEEVVERTRFYRTAGTVAESQVRVVEVESESPILVSRNERLAAPWLADPELLPVVGRFAQAVDPAAADRRVGGGAMRFEEVYLSYSGDYRPEQGERLLLVDVGRKVAAYGRLIEPRAVATVVSLADDAMRVRLTEQFGPVLESVVAVPLGLVETVRGVATALEDGPVAHIIDFVDTNALYGPAARGFVNLGAEDGVEVGDEFVAYLPAQTANGARVESESVATLRVIRVEPRVATVRVLSLAHPILAAGMPVALTRKVPRATVP